MLMRAGDACFCGNHIQNVLELHPCCHSNQWWSLTAEELMSDFFFFCMHRAQSMSHIPTPSLLDISEGTCPASPSKLPQNLLKWSGSVILSEGCRALDISWLSPVVFIFTV
ncbi:hypothetical protein AMECASPLE_032920 [Ameca splendens]|uniref:Uncharacterized protein n=1 Tax=Ameca splendens TaxID=208324 RepID=A0ABV0Y729_9TELE